MMNKNNNQDPGSNNHWEVVENAEVNERTPFVDNHRSSTDSSLPPSPPTAPAAPVEAYPVEEDEYSFKPIATKKHEGDVEPSAPPSPEDGTPASTSEEEAATDGDDDYSDVNVRASVAAGAVTGLLLGGPFLSILGAAGAAMYATEKGAVGDVVRAGGEVASSVGEKASKLNQRHGCVSKAKEAAGNAGRKICEASKDQKVWKKVKTTAETVGTKAKEVEHKHHFLENMLRWISKGLASMAERIKTSSSGSHGHEQGEGEHHYANQNTKQTKISKNGPTATAVPVSSAQKSDIV